MSRITIPLAIVTCVAFSAACDAPSDLETAYALKCTQCGRNGLPLVAAAVAPAALNEAELEQFGAFTGAIEPLCEPGTAAPSSCDINASWASWRSAGTHRADLFAYVVKAALGAGFIVFDPTSGGSDAGMFGMAPNVATNPWTKDDQELVTASIALLTNATIGVDICLATGAVDACPPTDYTYLELQAAGDLFDGSGRLVAGSPWAPDPQINARTCSAGIGSCPAIEDNLGYYSVLCTYTGIGQRRRATSCTSATTGKTWNNPVTAFVVADPGNYYLGTRPPTTFY